MHVIGGATITHFCRLGTSTTPARACILPVLNLTVGADVILRTSCVVKCCMFEWDFETLISPMSLHAAPTPQAARSSAEPSFLVDCLFEESGKHAVVMDSRGNVFSLLFEENRFSMLARSGHGGLCVGFASRFKPMVLAGLRNNKLHMYNGISRALEGNLAGLTSSPVSLFTAPDGHTFGAHMISCWHRKNAHSPSSASALELVLPVSFIFFPFPDCFPS